MTIKPGVGRSQQTRKSPSFPQSHAREANLIEVLGKMFPENVVGNISESIGNIFDYLDRWPPVDARWSRAEEVGDGVVTGVQAETRQVSEITELLGVAPAERT